MVASSQRDDLGAMDIHEPIRHYDQTTYRVAIVRGAISLSSSSNVPVIVGFMMVTPVALPPGRPRLFTKPFS
jgi:hypothetical protein